MARRRRGGIDRISRLPDNLREQILQFLPLRDAVKASILSTSWRNMWMNIPTLVIDQSLCKVTTVAPIYKLMYRICRVLLLHRGPLTEFTLSIPLLGRHPARIGEIIMFLQPKQVHGLTLNTQNYKLPSCLFETSFSRQLKTLRLSGCQFPAPASCVSFEGFSVLTVLELRNVKMSAEEASTVLWSFRCRLPSTLTLNGFGGYSRRPPISIEAPRLEYLYFVGNFCSLHLKHTPCLKRAILRKRNTFLEDRKDESVLKMWGGLAAAELLCIGPFLPVPRSGKGQSASAKASEPVGDATAYELQ